MFSKVVRQPLSRRFQLRNATAAEHSMLDAMAGGFSDRAGYKAYVRAIYAFRLPLEGALAETSLTEALRPWSPLVIADALERDMDALDLDRPEILPLSPIATKEALLGLLYTLEGSSLGAQVLVKQAAALGFSGESGAAHLARQAGSIESWKGYCALLESMPDLAMDDVSSSACETFQMARRSFERVQSARRLQA